ncbi:hypothetical protein [Paenibacillus pini]|uniref:Uncharacterized protein n=1 Tax=Paenibacillus pini JCM 16418 TaxID=1236976 RepID=W7Z4H3_9BACL|nr:hypothetical protein [Paenibacillus pini]GAF09269.1 hypothetical protein JCM16418_3395 [Paenibacillus pini JCM 16418]
MRIASHVTTEKLRFASDVTLLASCPSTYAAGFSYICVNANGRSVEQYIYNGSSAHNTVVMVAENLSSPVTYGIEFNKVNNYRLSYTIKGHKNSRNFEVKSQVSLLNMELKKQAIIIGGTTAFKAIAYKVTP